MYDANIHAEIEANVKLVKDYVDMVGTSVSLCPAPDCDEGHIAKVNLHDSEPMPVYFCPRFFRENLAARSRALIHEAAHVVLNTQHQVDIYADTREFDTILMTHPEVAAANSDHVAAFVFMSARGATMRTKRNFLEAVDDRTAPETYGFTSEVSQLLQVGSRRLPDVIRTFYNTLHALKIAASNNKMFIEKYRKVGGEVSWAELTKKELQIPQLIAPHVTAKGFDPQAYAALPKLSGTGVAGNEVWRERFAMLVSVLESLVEEFGSMTVAASEIGVPYFVSQANSGMMAHPPYAKSEHTIIAVDPSSLDAFAGGAEAVRQATAPLTGDTLLSTKAFEPRKSAMQAFSREVEKVVLIQLFRHLQLPHPELWAESISKFER